MKKTPISSTISNEISDNLNDNQLTDKYMGQLIIEGEYEIQFSPSIINTPTEDYKITKNCIVDVYGPNIRANEKEEKKILFLRSGDGKFLSKGVEEVLNNGGE